MQNFLSSGSKIHKISLRKWIMTVCLIFFFLGGGDNRLLAFKTLGYFSIVLSFALFFI